MKSFSIERIKSFKDNTKIDIKPLTIFVGRNSCGKSSLIRFPVVVAQSFDDNSHSPLQLYGKLIDYGTYNDVVFGHKETDISFSLKYDLDIQKDYFAPSFDDEKETDIREVELVTSIRNVNEHARVSSQKLYVDGKCVYEYISDDDEGKFRINSVYDPENKTFRNSSYEIACNNSYQYSFICPPPRGETLMKCVKDSIFPNSDFSFDDDRRHLIIKLLSKKSDDERVIKLREAIINNEAIEMSEDDLYIALASISGTDAFVYDLQKVEDLLIRSKKERDKVLIERIKQWGYTFDEVRFWYINNCFQYYYSLMFLFNDICHREMSMLSYIGPFRQNPERILRDSGSLPHKEVGVKGEYTSNVLIEDYHKNKSLIENVSVWLKKSLGYDLKIQSVTNGYYQLLLEDENGVISNISDVGYGISQILPIIIQTMFSVSKRSLDPKCGAAISHISIIEQPELHLHPAAQADLADLFAACIKNNYSRNLLIETHSEHFIRKLQVLIANKESEITSDDVAIYYVDKNDNGEAYVEKMNILPNGQFEKEWPTGFFDKAFELAMELLDNN